MSRVSRRSFTSQLMALVVVLSSPLQVRSAISNSTLRDSVFNIPAEYFQKDPELLPLEYRKQLDQVGVSAQTGIEISYLLQGLQKAVSEIEANYTEEEIVKRVSEMKDSGSIEFYGEGIGKAGLKILTDGRHYQFIRTVKLNSGLYLIFADEDVNPDFILKKYAATQYKQLTESQQDEFNIAKELRSGLNFLAANMLMFGVLNENHIPLHLQFEEQLASEKTTKIIEQSAQSFEQEISPMRIRYAEINKLLKNKEMAARQQKQLQAEKYILQREILRKANNPRGAWSQIIEVVVAGRQGRNTVEGLPVVTVFTKNGSLINHELWEKPKLFSWEYLKRYGQSVLVMPNLGDITIIGGIFAALQTGIAYGGLSLARYLGVSSTLNPAIAADVTASWGVVLGVFNRTYNNVLLSGSDFSRNIKTTLSGVGYGYHMHIKENSSLLDMSLFDHLSIWATQLSKGLVKKASQDSIVFRKETGENAGEFKIQVDSKIFKRGFKITLEKRAYEVNVRQLTLFLPKLLSLCGMWYVYWAMGPLFSKLHVRQAQKFAQNFSQEWGSEHPRTKHWESIANKIANEWDRNRLFTVQPLVKFIEEVRPSEAELKSTFLNYFLLSHLSPVGSNANSISPNQMPTQIDELARSSMSQEANSEYLKQRAVIANAIEDIESEVDVMIASEVDSQNLNDTQKIEVSRFKRYLISTLLTVEEASKFAGFYSNFVKSSLAPVIQFFKQRGYVKFLQSFVGRTAVSAEIFWRSRYTNQSAARATPTKCAQLLGAGEYRTYDDIN